MKKNNLTRRQFLGTASAGAIAAVASGGITAYGNKKAGELAVLGGNPVRTKRFPSCTIIDETDEKSVIYSLRS